MPTDTRLVIDVDSHFVEPPNWLETVDPELAHEVAVVAPTSIGEQAIGEVFESIPLEGRPPFEEFVPEADEDAVMALAGAWSIDPQKVGKCKFVSDSGFVGDA